MTNLPTKIGVSMGIIAVGIILSIYAVFEMNMDEGSAVASMVNINEIRQVSHALGSDSAPITIIEFGDFQCPFCSEWYIETGQELNEKYVFTNQVELIFIDYPFLGPDSYPTAHASYCAEEQNRYWDFHEILYLNQGATNDGWANSENIRDFANQIGLDLEQYDQCMSSNAFSEKLDTSLELGNTYDITQTPTFIVVNNEGEYQKIEGKQPLIVFDELIKKLQ
ncbi:DsbA family protein [Nitrosopumilus sp.]|uniref:DsbA family protein n=1 Tax=Nitrosopumilus sp. TaxID=2024843 RepID=UPI003D0FCDE5